MTSRTTDPVARGLPRLIVPASTPAARPDPAIGAVWFIALCLGLAAVAAGVSSVAPAIVPFLLALAPAAFALGLAWREGNGAVGRLLRSLTIRPADRRWYLVILLPIAWALAVVAVTVNLGQPTAGLFDKLLPAVLILPLVVLVPAFAEELAWRGYALPRAMAVLSPVRASLVLAVPWALMHLVLQLPGGINASVSWWPTIVSIVGYSVVLTWIYVGTGGSVLMTALVHAGLNGVVPVMAALDVETAWEVRAVLAAVIAIVIVAFGGATLRRRPSPRPEPAP